MAVSMQPSNLDLSSEDEFEGVSDNGDNPSRNATGRKTLQDIDKDSEDEVLENLVLKSKTSFIDQLLDESRGFDFDAALSHTSQPASSTPSALDRPLEHVPDADLFVFDNTRTPAALVAEDLDDDDEQANGNGNDSGMNAAWYDSDDDRGTISLASKNMLRKLRISENEDVITGREYSRRLQEQYTRLQGSQPNWARTALEAASAGRADGSRPAKRRRRSSASDTDSSSDADDDEPLPSALPLANFFRDIRNMQPTSKKKRRTLRPETIAIQWTRELEDDHRSAVTSLAFHPAHPSILLSASRSSLLRLHKFDPAAHPTPNPTITTVQTARMPIVHAAFLGPAGTKILMAGRRRYMYSWDLSAGHVSKFSQIVGHKTRREHRTFENFRPSPCGTYIALAGSSNKGGGNISILSATTMMPVAEMRIDSSGGLRDFVWWRDGAGLTALGFDGRVSEFSLRHRTIVARWTDQGNIGGTTLALGGSGGPSLVGTDRWVAVGSKTGIVNIYDRNVIFTTVTATDNHDDIDVVIENKGNPEPTRVFEQLVVRATTIVFSPDAQIMAIATDKKQDCLKLVHLPTCTVFRNWPTEKTHFGRVTAVAFSRDGVLAVGNDIGRIKCWEIRP